MTNDIATSRLESAHHEFRASLVEIGLLVPMGIDGLYARGAAYERVVDGIEFAIHRKGAAVHGDTATVLRPPPVYSREVFEMTNYIASFPHLTGAISTFTGTDKNHQRLLEEREAGQPWDGHLSAAGTMLVPAACHPCYATLPKVLPDEGELMNIYGYCFRHEPAVDPMRMQAFRMHEFVMVGTQGQAQSHRESWLRHVACVLDNLGLEAVEVPANDPFFGRLGKLLATNQRDDGLKTELTVRIYADLDDGTAVASLNYHHDHFGEIFGLSTPSGAVAHSACAAFGIDRIALALLRTHGLDPSSWPPDVCRTMGW